MAVKKTKAKNRKRVAVLVKKITRKPKRASAKPAKQVARQAAKKPIVAPRESAKTAAHKVSSWNTGAGLWFRVAGGIEHAVVRKSGGAGVVVALTDAGTEVVLSLENLFHTAADARAQGRLW